MEVEAGAGAAVVGEAVTAEVTAAIGEAAEAAQCDIQIREVHHTADIQTEAIHIRKADQGNPIYTHQATDPNEADLTDQSHANSTIIQDQPNGLPTFHAHPIITARCDTAITTEAILLRGQADQQDPPLVTGLALAAIGLAAPDAGPDIGQADPGIAIHHMVQGQYIIIITDITVMAIATTGHTSRSA